MGVAELKIDPLAGGFYTVSEAARLLRMENRRRIYGWLSGHKGSGQDPIIMRDYLPLHQSQEMSFWDLIEVRFIEHFRSQGVPLQTLRKVALKARKDMRQKHPFALSKKKFLTDRKKIFEQTVGELGDRKTLDALGNQYEMYDVIEEALSKGIEFDPSGLAREWRPLPGDCPNVLVHPLHAYGHPTIGKNRAPTGAIVRLFKAEKSNVPRVAHWFKVSEDEVREAVEFEIRLAA